MASVPPSRTRPSGDTAMPMQTTTKTLAEVRKNQSRFEVSQPRKPGEQRLDLGLEHQRQQHEGDAPAGPTPRTHGCGCPGRRARCSSRCCPGRPCSRCRSGLTRPSGTIGSLLLLMARFLDVLIVPSYTCRIASLPTVSVAAPLRSYEQEYQVSGSSLELRVGPTDPNEIHGRVREFIPVNGDRRDHAQVQRPPAHHRCPLIHIASTAESAHAPVCPGPCAAGRRAARKLEPGSQARRRRPPLHAHHQPAHQRGVAAGRAVVRLGRSAALGLGRVGA